MTPNLPSQKLVLSASIGAQIAAIAVALLLLAVGVFDTGASYKIARDFVFVSSIAWFFALLLSAGLHLFFSNNSTATWKYWLTGASTIFLCQITILVGAMASA